MCRKELKITKHIYDSDHIISTFEEKSITNISFNLTLILSVSSDSASSIETFIIFLDKYITQGLYFYFQHGESTSIASQLTSPASQKSKDLNKVSLLLQDLGSNSD